MSWFKKTNFIFLLLFSFSARGEGPLTIEQAVSEALNANPALKAKEASVQASRARVGIARSLDDPMVGVEFEDVPINTTDITRGMQTNYSISQKIPFPSKLITQGKVAKKIYRAEENAYEMEKINLIVETEHAFHDLYLIEKSYVINRELMGLWRSLTASEEARYSTGNETSQNFLKAKVELGKLVSEASLLEARKIEKEAMLNVLRGKEVDEKIILAELPRHDHSFPSYADLEKRVLEKHPELQMARNSLAASKANLSFARQQLVLPDFQTRFGYGQRFGAQDVWTAEAMINIPFLWGKNRKAVKEAKAMEASVRHGTENIQNERLGLLKKSYARLESSKKIVELFQSKILPSASVAWKGAQSAYETGREDFINTLDTAREFQKARFETLEAFVEYHRAMSHLKMAVGEDWTRE